MTRSIRRFFISVLACLPVQAMTCAPATAALVCDNRAELLGQLQRDFGEQRRAAGNQKNGGFIEIFVSPEDGTYTIVSTNVLGMSCVIAFGKDYREEPLPLVGEKS